VVRNGKPLIVIWASDEVLLETWERIFTRLGIFITTWNEWPEHTHIEESQLNGTRYLEMTNENAKKWRRQ
jgi:hypothetical protein